MSNTDVVNIHGKQYVTVAGRIKMAHEDLKTLSIQTEVERLSTNGVLFKATVTTPKGTFTGFSYASLKAQGIEGQSPIEVAETSAIGRALGFAGYGVVQGMATADEVVKSEAGVSQVQDVDMPSEMAQQAKKTLECDCGTTGQYHARTCPANQEEIKDGEKVEEEDLPF